MKIVIKEGKHRISLRLPTGFLKFRFVAKAIAKETEGDIDPKTLQKSIKTAYKGLKEYIKENGHFNLVEVKRDNGESVLIRL